MIFDEELLKLLPKLGEVEKPPQNIDDLYNFFTDLENKIENNDFNAQLIGYIFYKFISSKDVRDRKVTSRVFEDLISTLFKGATFDDESKPNPSVPDYIKKYDKFSVNRDWNISSDLSGNKREKADNGFGDYYLSIKTLKGKLYNEELNILDNNYNKEVNIGSLSFRSLLVGLIDDDLLNKLGDRKAGLGSKPQLIEKVYTPLKNNGNWDSFINRLEVFMKYVYSNCDLLFVFKSGYVLDLYFISEIDFVDTLINIAKQNYDDFFTIFYRWENNNLRLHYDNLFEEIEKKNKLKKCTLKLNKLENNTAFQTKITNIKKLIKEELEKN